MRFAIVLAKFLCALITAAVLTAFIYYAAVGTPSELTSPINAVSISLILLIAALMVWALISMIGDIANYKIDRKTIKEALGSKQASSFNMASSQSETDLSAALSAMNENNQQTLQNSIQAITAKLNDYASENSTANYKITSAIAALSEKLLAGTGVAAETNVIASGDSSENVTTALQKISTDLADLRAQTEANFAAIVSQIAAQTQMIADITSSSANTTPASSAYSRLTEEANYPESIIGYNDSETEDEPEIADEPEEVTVLTEQETLKQPVTSPEEYNEPTILDNAQEDALNARFSPESEVVSEPLNSGFEQNQTDEIQTFINQETKDAGPEITDIPLEEFMAQTETVDLEEPTDAAEENNIAVEEEPVTVNLSAENSFDISLPEQEAPVSLDAPTEDDMTYEEPAKVNLGADDPFGSSTSTEEEPVSLDAPTENDITYDEPAKVDLGADDPFGASAPTEETSADLNAPAENDLAYEEPAKVDLGADNPFGAAVENSSEAPIGLRSPFDERNIIDENRFDLGADDPFGTAADFADPFAEPIAAPEDLDSLDAEDPFGATTSSDFTDADIENINADDTEQRREPRLDKIFNANLASELAELEILQDEPAETQKQPEQSENDELEQFFASHK